MVPTDIREQVRQLIRQAKTKEALEVLIACADQQSVSSLRSKVDSLSARFAKASNDFHQKGTLPRADFDLEINRIHDALQQLLDDDAPTTHTPAWATYGIAILLLLLTAAGIGFWLARDTGNNIVLDKKPADTSASIQQRQDAATVNHVPSVEKNTEQPTEKKEPEEKTQPVKNTGSSGNTSTHTTTTKTEPKPPVQPKAEPVSITIIADACWQNAKVYVDGTLMATLESTTAELELEAKNKPSTIRLETSDKFKDKVQTLKNNARVTFTCQ